MSTDKQEGMTIEQGNKLIAEFIGAEEIMDQVKTTSLGPLHKIHTGKMHFKDRSPDLMYVCKIIDLRYHSSWDWLMNVVEKIESIKCPFETREEYKYECNFNITTGFIDLTFLQRHSSGTFHPPVDHKGVYNWYGEDRQLKTKISAIWQTVVQFIEWYNNQNK